jgi:glutamate--cysteine ligase
MQEFEMLPAPFGVRDIQNYFKKWETSVELVGIEAEKIGIRFPSGDIVPYTGKNGFLAILGKMYEELGWKITQQEKHYILQMQRGKALLDLESDGRIELAGAPHESLHDLAREFRIHQNEIAEISDVFGVSWLGIGYHPTSIGDDIESLQVERKKELARYFFEKENKEKNILMREWSKKTAGIHVNLDYASEKDFSKKVRVILRILPILQAMFANSPFREKDFNKYVSYRSYSSQNGMKEYEISKKFFNSECSYLDWIDFVLSLPAIFFKREEKWIYPKMSFRRFMEEGFENDLPSEEDFHMHMKSVWTDIRMRNTIEIRIFDSLPPSLVPSVPAIVKGLIYDSENLSKILEMTQGWNYEEHQQLKENAAKYGLQAEFYGKKLLEYAKELLEMAEKALKKNRIVNAYGEDESIYLRSIKEFIFVRGKSPAEWLIQKWEGEWGENFFPVFEWCKY